MILQSCTGFSIQNEQPCSPNCKFGASLFESPDLHSEHVPWAGNVNIGNTETTDFRVFCKAGVITVTFGSLCKQRFPEAWTLGRVFESKQFLEKKKKATPSKRNLVLLKNFQLSIFLLLASSLGREKIHIQFSPEYFIWLLPCQLLFWSKKLKRMSKF